jgi:hypothetical protein
MLYLGLQSVYCKCERAESDSSKGKDPYLHVIRPSLEADTEELGELCWIDASACDILGLRYEGYQLFGVFLARRLMLWHWCFQLNTRHYA